MRVIEPEVFVHDSCLLGEGPFWFDHALWWLDVESGRLHRIDATGSTRSCHEMGRRIGAAAPIDDTRFVVALQDGLGIFHRDTEVIDLLATPEKDRPDNRFNDGKCDPAGRFVAGTLNMKGQAKQAALYSMSGDGRIATLLSPVSLSNGLAWSEDGCTLFYIDTPTREIAAFPYDQETGGLGGRTVVVKVPGELGMPDGMDIDTDGNLWVGHWGGNAVRCWSPVTGECLAVIPVPCSNVTSCCFGGPHLDRLFITTARVGLSDDQLKQQPLAGSVFVCNPGVSGTPVKTFRPEKP